MKSVLVVAVLLVASAYSITKNHRRRFPGNYCLTRQPQQCCPGKDATGRDDTCTVPIHDTLCYCDRFCAIHNAEDCCPDFEDVCTGIKVTEKPPLQPINQCVHGGQFYNLQQSVKINCNTCKCVVYKPNSGSAIQTWECENQACINEQSLVDSINNGFYGWTAATYSKFDGVSVSDGLRYYLGTIPPKRQVMNLNPLQIDPDETFNVTFDSREKWSNSYIHPAMDQGECASSWAFSTASVAADRWSIQSKGSFKDQMSVQSMISCSRVPGCEGGRIEDAWYYLQREGAVSEECYPYTSGTTRTKGECRYLSEMVCDDNHVHKTTPPYRIANDERQIMKEIQTQGPVQAIITVYPDFYLYQGGIYRHTEEEKKHTEHDHTLSGTHSVKIIGWGEENGVKFWRCVNSWGQRWGEDGMFKIRRGESEIGIEDFVIGVWARVEKHDIQDRKLRKLRRHRHK